MTLKSTSGLKTYYRELLSKHPYVGRFDPEQMARNQEIVILPNGHTTRDKNRNQVQTKTRDGLTRRFTWIGARGPLADCSAGTKWHYMRIVNDYGNEDAAKEWAWLQGFRVNVGTTYIEAFMQSLAKNGMIPQTAGGPRKTEEVEP